MRLARFFVAMLLGSLCLAGAARAATLNVPGDYGTIQAAVDAAAGGDIIQIAAGTFTEQVEIAKPLTLAGAGVGSTIIKSPAVLPLLFMTGTTPNHPVVYIHGTDDVLLRDLTVDGDMRGNANYRFEGVAFWMAGGGMTDCAVVRVQNSPLDGAQHGVGVYGNNNDTGTAGVALDNVVVSQFQKGGIVFSGVGLAATLNSVTVVGSGPTAVIAQNGIQIGYGATGVLTDCVVYGGVEYTGDNWTATGALFFESGDVTVNGGEIYNCQAGLSHAQYGYVYSPPTAPRIVLNGLHGHDNMWNAYADLRDTGAGLDLTVTGCDFHDNPGTGLGLYGYGAGSWYPGWTGGIVNATVTGNRIANGGYGLEAWGQDPVGGGNTVNCVVRTNDFSGNADYGVYSNFPTLPLDAELNWWGGSDGPNLIAPKASGLLPATVSPLMDDGALPKAAAATIVTDSMTAEKATGVNVSPYVDFDPWLTGNVVCVPDPRQLSLAAPDGAVAVKYLGGGSAALYGFSMEVLWDPTVADATLARPDAGPFRDTPIFYPTPITSGTLKGFRVDATLTGAATGILYGDLFKLNFSRTAGAYGTTPVDVTLLSMRDNLNADLTGVAEDDGLVVVDATAPVIAGVAIANATLTHTDDYIKDTDHAVVTATVTDDDPAFGIANIRADLTGLGGGASVAPATWVGGVATWDVAGAVCTPADGTVTVYVTAVDPLGNAAAPGSDDIIADNTPPAPLAGLTAAPGHQKVDLAWTAASGGPTDYYGTLIRYARWTGYPVYGAAEPAYPDGPTAGDGTAFDALGAVSSATHSRPAAADRDIYYYSGFVYDIALNFSPAAATHNARATCYWLGDVCGISAGDLAYNGRVDVSDINVLGAAYGSSPLTSPYDEADVGPTHNRSRVGIPLTDGRVDFEDLMIFAMNFGVVSKAAPLPGELPVLAWSRVDDTTWSLTLAYACPALQGVRLSGDLPDGATARVAPGALIAGQRAPFFLKNAGALDVGFAMLGTNAGVAGAGELLRVTLPAGATPANVTIEARGVGNEDLGTTVTSPDETAVPRVFALAQNVPNPFNPMTKISFALPSDRTVRLRVYGVDGRLVRTLIDGPLAAGSHDAIWDGRNDGGRVVASGTYFCRIEAGEYVQTRKMSLMK